MRAEIKGDEKLSFDLEWPNGGLATKLKTRSTKWQLLYMKGSILYLPRSILAHCGYSKVSL